MDRPSRRDPVEWLPVSSGPWGAIAGFGLAVAVAVLALGDLGGERAVAGLLLAAFIAASTWTVLLRPRVGLAPRAAPRAPAHAVVLRGMVSQTHVPLAEVTGLDVRQVLVVRAGERRFLSPAVSRSRARIAGRRPTGSAGAPTRPGLPGLTPPPEPTRSAAAPDVAEVVLLRLDRARDDARVHRLPGGPASRAWAWPEIAVLAVTAIGSLGGFVR